MRRTSLSLTAAALALCVQSNAAQAAKPTAQRAPPPPCCVAPAPALPAAPDIRGTPQQPLAVEVTDFPPPPAPPRAPVEPPKDRSGWFIAAATGALAIFTWLLWRATGALVNENVDTAKRELRAYVFVREPFIESVDALNNPDGAGAYQELRQDACIRDQRLDEYGVRRRAAGRCSGARCWANGAPRAGG